jgi:predicted DNA-binding transcriptional regulator YafY
LEENIEKQFRVDRITSAVIDEITGQPFTMAELQRLFSDSSFETKDLVENRPERISSRIAARVTTVALKTRNIQLSEDIAKRIASFAPKGDGGFQRLIRMLQENLVKSSLSLTEEQVQRVVRYAEKYGKGGYQVIFKAILSSLEH